MSSRPPSAPGRLGDALRTSTGASRLPALDGFRGLFVTLVLLYHFGVSGLVGGWVGINHFFVFSGYLIARLLISERARTGRIEVWRFYRRRAERLVPALVVLLTAVLLYAVLVATPAGRHRVAGDALATLGWVTNWRLITRDDAYFDLVGDPSPLRHAWTLGVEEQFYAVVPFLILLLFAVVRGRGRKVLVAAALAAGSAWWTAYLATDGAATFARLYYGTDTRAQALLVGVMFALLLGRGDDGRLGATLEKGTIEVLGFIGVAISLSAFVLVAPDSEWLFTRGGMLFFAVGAGLMGLAAVDERPMLLTRIASWRPLVLLGQMTYGLYLYHWPIHLWVGPMLSGLPLPFAIGVKLALTVVAAYVSFRFLEVPVFMRGFGALVPRTTTRVWRIPLVALLALGTAFGVLYRAPVSTSTLDVPALVSGDPPFRAPAAPVTFALLGDSVASSLNEGWRAGDYPGVTLVNVSRIGCDLIDAPMVHDGDRLPSDAACRTWRQSWGATLREQGVSELVVLSGLQFLGDHDAYDQVVAPRTAKGAELISATLDQIERTARSAGVRRVTIVSQVCRQIDRSKLDPRFTFFAEPASDPENIAWSNSITQQWVSAGPNRRYLDLFDPLCGKAFQPSVHDVPLYHDTVHFSPSGAAMVWTWLTPRVIAP